MFDYRAIIKNRSAVWLILFGIYASIPGCLFSFGATLGRAQSFGPDPLSWLYLFLTLLPVLLVAWLTTQHIDRQYRLIPYAIWALWIILPIIAFELWFGLEDFVFYHEAFNANTPQYSRGRWWPFTDHGLIYANGKFFAHC